MRHAITALLLATGFALGAPAAAALYQFDISGQDSARFRLNSSPAPTSFAADRFLLTAVPVTVNGVAGSTDLYFYTPSQSGGVQLVEYAIDLFGPQLFTGATSAPQFTLGVFAVSDPFGAPATLAITAVPEPASWALMIAGFGLVGASLRRRRVVA